jgi:hypothetical protein
MTLARGGLSPAPPAFVYEYKGSLKQALFQALSPDSSYLYL